MVDGNVSPSRDTFKIGQRMFGLGAGAIVAAFLALSSYATPLYRTEPLYGLTDGPGFIYARAINDAGVVAGMLRDEAEALPSTSQRCVGRRIRHSPQNWHSLALK